MTNKKETHLDSFYQSLNRLNKIIDELELERDTISKCFELALDEETERRELNKKLLLLGMIYPISIKNGARGSIILDEAKNENITYIDWKNEKR